jgi:transcriptional regulator with XRE-family HTH domain
MRLGDVLRKWRLMSEIDQRTIAAAIGVSFSTLCRIERGKAPDAYSLVKIINWLTSEPSAEAKP